MVDQERVCCMCGDVGFADKLFHCSGCRFRFQHSYCSNYYYGNDGITSSLNNDTRDLCDWCLSEGRSSSTTNNNYSNNNSTSTYSKHNNNKRSLSSSSSSSSIDNNNHHFQQVRSVYATGTDNNRIKQHDQQNTTTTTTTSTVASPREKSGTSRNSGIPSPRTGTHRRYKLLKDVMC